MFQTVLVANRGVVNTPEIQPSTGSDSQGLILFSKIFCKSGLFKIYNSHIKNGFFKNLKLKINFKVVVRLTKFRKIPNSEKYQFCKIFGILKKIINSQKLEILKNSVKIKFSKIL